MRLGECRYRPEDIADRFRALGAMEEEDSLATLEKLRFTSFNDFGSARVAWLDFTEERHLVELCGSGELVVFGSRYESWFVPASK